MAVGKSLAQLCGASRRRATMDAVTDDPIAACQSKEKVVPPINRLLTQSAFFGTDQIWAVPRKP